MYKIYRENFHSDEGDFKILLKSVFFRRFWFDFCFKALQHILGNFGHSQLP